MKNFDVRVSEHFTVEFFKNNRDLTRPLCKIKGRICFIHNKDRNYPAEGETWEVEVCVVKERYLVVFPIRMEMNKEETELMKWHKMNELKTKYSNENKKTH